MRTVGYRARVGVIFPATNSAVEHDLQMVRIDGLTFHMGRIELTDPRQDTEESFERVILEMAREAENAARRVALCGIDYLVLGMSAPLFWGGVAGELALRERLEESIGVPVISGPRAVLAGLDLLGARRLSFLSPYQRNGDAEVTRFFEEAGHEVVTSKGMKVDRADWIADMPEQDLRAELLRLDSPEVDAIVQVGTNASAIRIADDLERSLGKPVIAINAATIWSTLRRIGIEDQMEGMGQLLREH